MFKIFEIKVRGLPPQKDDTKSPWQASEAERTLALRHEVAKRRNGAGPFSTPIKLHLRIFLPHSEGAVKHGELETYIAGVCAALEHIPAGAVMTPSLQNAKGVENPCEPLLIGPEASIMLIDAKKIISPDVKEPFYEIQLEGE